MLVLFTCAIFFSSTADSIAAESQGQKEVVSILPEEGDAIPMPESAHPYADVINRFAFEQAQAGSLEKSGFNKSTYLEVLNGMVQGLIIYQNEEGDIVDPWYEGDVVFGDTGEPGDRHYRHYATPHYAHAVSLLVRTGYNEDPAVRESGIRAFEQAVRRMLKGRELSGPDAWRCGDFYPYALMRAYLNFKEVLPSERISQWDDDLALIVPSKNYSSPTATGNWNVVSHCGEFLRAQAGFTTMDRTEQMLEHKQQYFSDTGTWMFESFAYDNFPRYHITNILVDGYNGAYVDFYRDKMWRGAWISLFTQSPTGAHPTGFRSAQHLWNEAQIAAIFEIYAAAYAEAGFPKIAGTFKRGAHLAVEEIRRWIRPDGALDIVKNHFHPEKRQGYEMYTLFTCYNSLAAHMLATAYERAAENVKEYPAPADIGGYAFLLDEDHSEVFPDRHYYHILMANAGGTAVQYCLDPNPGYDPLGIQRVQFSNGPVVIGPTDGRGSRWQNSDLALAVGPAWKDGTGRLVTLAGQSNKPEIEVLLESPELVHFRARHKVSQDVALSDGTGKVPFLLGGVVPVEGCQGMAYGFSQIDGHLISQEQLPWMAEDFSLSLWFQPKDISGRQSLISSFIEGNEAHAFLLEVDSARGMRILFRDPPGTQGGITEYVPQSWDKSAWYHAAVVRQGTALITYLNGQAVSQLTVGDGIEESLYFLVGRLFATGTDRAFTGDMDELLVLNRALTAGDIAALAQGGALPEQNRALYLPMNSVPEGGTFNIIEEIEITPGKVRVGTRGEGGLPEGLRILYPFVAYDGRDEATVLIEENSAKIYMQSKGACFRAVTPGLSLEREKMRLSMENGLMDVISLDMVGKAEVVYEITPVSRDTTDVGGEWLGAKGKKENAGALVETVPLELDLEKTNDVKVRRLENGEYEIITTGGDPYIFTKPYGTSFLPLKTHMLSFEYFSPKSIDSFVAYFGPVLSGQGKVYGEALPVSEVWSPYSVNMLEYAEAWGPETQFLRLDFGSTRDITFRLRDLKLRPGTEKEWEGVEERLARFEADKARAKAIVRQLEAGHPAKIEKVEVVEDIIQVRGQCPANLNAYLVELPRHLDEFDGELLMQAPAKKIEEEYFTFSFPRLTEIGDHPYDRIYSRWAVVLEHENAGRQLLSSVRRVENIPAKYSNLSSPPKSKKGIGGIGPTPERLADYEALGIQNVGINLVANKLMSPVQEKGTIPFEYLGRVYWIHKEIQEKYDSQFKAASERGYGVNIVLLFDPPDTGYGEDIRKILAHPDYRSPGIFAHPNVLNAEAMAWYAAVMHFVADRYCQPGNPYGRIHRWVIHNEVDVGWVWTNAGEKVMDTYMDLYHRSMRLVHDTVRQYDSEAHVFISFTNNWTNAGAHRYRPKEMVERLMDYTRTEGEWNWGIAYHPYPENLRDGETWKDIQVTFDFDTPNITFRNLEVLEAWMKTAAMKKADGSIRPLVLTEQGINCSDYSEEALQIQAAGLAYAWKKVNRLDTVQVFIYHRWVDHPDEGGLLLGLRRNAEGTKQDPGEKKPSWVVYQAAGTMEEERAFHFAKKRIGIEEWDQIFQKVDAK